MGCSPSGTKVGYLLFEKRGKSKHLTALNHSEGSGVQILLGGGSVDTSSKSVLDKSYIFDSSESSVQYAQDWSKEFAPKLVRTSSDGKVHVDTKFSRLLGKPPLMVAGMTPTSVNETFVSGAVSLLSSTPVRPAHILFLSSFSMHQRWVPLRVGRRRSLQ